MEHDETAYLLFMAPIEDETVQNLVHAISQAPKHIRTFHILMSTAGGSISSALALNAILRALPQRIVMHNIGSVDSSGIIVFLAGEERYAAPHACFLIHGARYPEEERGEPNSSALRERLSWLDGEQQRMHALISKRTSIPSQELDELFESGQLKSAQYALSMGIVNEIKELSLADTSLFIVVRTPPMA